MLDDGQPWLAQGMKEGGFRPDVIRKTQQVLVGWTLKKKLVPAFYEKSTAAAALANLQAVVLKDNPEDPLVWCVKCDGGHAAHMGCFGIVRGKAEPIVGAFLLPA
jgi:hypothetical protein